MDGLCRSGGGELEDEVACVHPLSINGGHRVCAFAFTVDFSVTIFGS